MPGPPSAGRMIASRPWRHSVLALAGPLALLSLLVYPGVGESFSFSDDPLVEGVTPVRAVHITELRTIANSLRSHYGLAPVDFTDPLLVVGTTPIRAAHIAELRSALEPLYDALVRPRPTYPDPVLLAGKTVAGATHIGQLRNAVLALDLFPLAIGLSGVGSGAVNTSLFVQPSIQCGGQCRNGFASGAIVTLVATPEGDSAFAGWIGCDAPSGASCAMTMTSAKSVTAVFNLATVPLSVAKLGTGDGAVTSTPAGIGCGSTCFTTFGRGTVVTLTAAPGQGTAFDGWSGCDSAAGTTCTVTLNAVRVALATFTRQGTAPTISNLQFSPTSVSKDSGIVMVNGSVSFVDPDGDLRRLRLSRADGQFIDTAATTSLTSGTIVAAVAVDTSVAGVFSFTVQAFDANNNASNTLTGLFSITPTSAVDRVVLADALEIEPTSSSSSNRARLVVDGGELFWRDTSSTPIKKLPVGGGTPVALADASGTPANVVVSDSRLFWLDGCAVKTAGLDGAAPTLLARGDVCAGTQDLVVDDTGVYWVDSAQSPNTYFLRKTPFSGPTVTLVTTGRTVSALARDATRLYWVEDQFSPEAALNSLPLAGGEVTKLTLDLGAQVKGGLVVADGEIFFADTNFVRSRLLKMSVSGGDVTALALLPTFAVRIAVHAGFVYWIDSTSLNRIPATGGTPETLVSGLNGTVDLAVTDTGIIWTETPCCAHGVTGAVKHAGLDGTNVTVLADGTTGARGPGRLALSTSDVYWADSVGTANLEGWGSIARMPLLGGPATTVVSGVGNSTLGPIAVDATHVYVADGYTVKAIPRAGGAAETLAVGDSRITGLAVDGVSVYWIEDGGIPLVRKVTAGGGPTTLASGSGPAGPLAIDNANVYWMGHFDTISKIPKNGGTLAVIGSGLPFLSDFTTDGESVYFTEQDTGLVTSVPSRGGTPMVLAPLAGGTWRILGLDTSNLYWIDQSTVSRVPKAGGAIELLVSPLASDLTIPNAIAVDDTSVYWIEVDGGTLSKRGR